MTLLPIVLLILIATLTLFFILKDFGMVSKKQKSLTFISLLILAVIIGFYSYRKSQVDKQIFLLQMAFLRGETILCKNTEVDAKNFNFVSGTLNFIGKKDTPFHNLIFSLNECVQKNNKQNINTIQEQLEKE
ncbi:MULTISPECIES: hypothetical protein [unclassified Helicobacter]|uniref:hypothetical protein n=1 Tax=unclassified Helicobacter TaxID=2593540 RepID=UPI000CF0993B|nr:MULTISPECIES: hypothetical protein [unclassified Helicobacter]